VIEGGSASITSLGPVTKNAANLESISLKIQLICHFAK
jgi:hypothetical protein